MTQSRRKRATASAIAEGRIAELEALLRSQADAARTQAALYRIATLASRSETLDEVYPGIHEVLKELMYAENIYIALYDSDRRQISFAYWVDSVDTDWPDPRVWDPMGEGYTKGLTGYVLKTGRMLHANVEGQQRLIDEKKLEFIGAMANDYLGIPLETEGRTIGVLALQSYRPDVAYTRDDENLLIFVGQHIAAALARAQATAELRQRNAELAIINQIGRALVTQRETQAVMEAVGVGAAEALGANGLSICLVDDYGMIGTAVITASRLSSAAAAGQILLAPRSFAAVEDLVEAEPVGELELKGFSRPISPMNVIGRRDGAAGGGPAGG